MSRRRADLKTLRQDHTPMIEAFRKATHSLLAKILLGLVVISFAVWGVGDMLRATGSNTVAEIGDETISAQEFARRIRREVDAAGLRGQIDLLDQLNYDDLILSRMAAQKALAIEARSLGVDGADETVVEQLRRTPGMVDSEGKFRTEVYEGYLRQNGLRKRDYEKELRERIAGDLLMIAVAGGARQPAATVEQIWRHRSETRDIAFATVSETALPEPETPDDAVLQAYHQEEAERFTVPEKRSLRVLTITAAPIADIAAVTEDEIADAYADFAAANNRPERRNIEQLVFASEAEAGAAAERARGGEPFAQIAAERGVEAADLALGYLTKAGFAELQPEAAEAAFAADAEADPIVGPVKTPTGWSLIRVAGVQPGEETPLEAVRERLTREIAVEAAARQLPDIANAVEDRRAAGLSFEEIAKAEPAATLVEVEIDEEGRDAEGGRPDALPNDPALLSTAFEMAPGEEMDLAETPDLEYYAIEVDSVEPARLRDFEEARADVLDAWKAQTRRDRLMEQALSASEAAEAAAKAGTPGKEALEAAILDAFGAPAPEILTAAGLTRGASSPGLPAGALTDLFEPNLEDAVGAATAAPSPGGAEYVIAIVAAASVPDSGTETAQAEIEQLRREASGGLANDLAGLFQASVVTRLGYRKNDDLREQVARQAF